MGSTICQDLMCTSVLSKQFMCNQVKEEEICVQYIQRSADSELKEGLSEKRKKNKPFE